MTIVNFRVGNTIQVRSLPWLDALSFYFAVQSSYEDLLKWPEVFGVDRDDETCLCVEMSYYPEAHKIERGSHADHA